MELHKALLYANGAFQEYLGLLHALVLYNCVDGCERRQFMLENPMIFRAKQTQLSGDREDFLKVSNGHLIRLDNLGIEPEEYLRDENPLHGGGWYYLKSTEGLTMLPLKLVSMGFELRFHKTRCFALKMSEPPDFLGVSSFDYMPFIHRPVDDVVEIKRLDDVPDGFVVAPEIIVPSNEYLYWLQALEEILCYRLTPLQPLFPAPISPPVFTHCNVIFPNGDGICLPRLHAFIEDPAEAELPRYSDVAKPLFVFESQIRMTLALIGQEVNRRLAREHSQTDVVLSFDNQTTPSTPNGVKSRTRHNIPIADAAKACGKSKRTVERWLANKNTPSGFPGLNDSGVFLAWAEEYKGRKAIFSGKHKTGNTRKVKGNYDAIVADDGADA